MSTHRTRVLDIWISCDEDGRPPAPLDRLNAAIATLDNSMPALADSVDSTGDPAWVVTCEGPFAAAEVRALAKRLVRAMFPPGGHALMFLHELDLQDRRVLRVEIAGEEISVESGPED
jgi:hypothetical protein